MLRLAWHQGLLELKQLVRTRESVVFTLTMPVGLMLIFGAIFSHDVGAGVSMRQYFVTGMIASGLFTVAFGNLASTIPLERGHGILKRYRATPMPKWVYFAGKVLMVLALALAQTAVLLTVAVAVFGLDPPATADAWFTFAWVSTLGLTSFTLLGIAASSAARTPGAAPAVITPIAIVAQFISGIYFDFASLPGWMQQIAALFPLKWVCQGLRSIFLPPAFEQHEVAGSWELGRTALILALWCVLGLLLCLATFRWTTRRDG